VAATLLPFSSDRDLIRLNSRKALAAVCGLTLLLYAAYLTAFASIRPVLAQRFGLDAAESGRLLPPNFFGFIVGVLLFGALSDRFGRKPILIFNFVLAILGLVLMPLAANMTTATVLIALIGFATGGLMTAPALASELFPQNQAMIQSLTNALFGIGAIVSPFVSNRLLSSGTPYGHIYLGLAALNGVVLLALCALPVPPRLQQDEVVRAPLRESLMSPAFWALCLTQACYAGTELSLFVWLPTYFEVRWQADGAWWAGLLVSIFWLAMTLGRFALSAWKPRISLLQLNAILGLLTAVGIALTLLAPTPSLAMLCLFATGLPLSGVLVIVFAETGE
jgi:fucose permease